MTRDEHLSHAKKRALEFIAQGKLISAIFIFTSELLKREDIWAIGTISDEAMNALIFEVPRGPDSVKNWVESFK